MGDPFTHRGHMIRPRPSRAMSLPSPDGTDTSSGLRFAATEVPEITVWFWVAKLLTTGMGETTWDWSATALGPVPAIGLSGLGFVVALALQLRRSTYRPWVYWFAVLMVSVFGTTCADAVHVVLGVPYEVSAPVFLLAVLAAFGLWYRVEGPLSIHSIDTRRRELFYWAAVLGTFALGTAAGDFTASSLNIGFLNSILLFAAVIAIPAIGWWRFGMNPIFAFWFAYVITRPLGASFADWFSKPASITGLGLGNGPVSLLALAVFIPVVAWVAITKIDVQPGHGPH